MLVVLAVGIGRPYLIQVLFEVREAFLLLEARCRRRRVTNERNGHTHRQASLMVDKRKLISTLVSTMLQSNQVF